MAGHDGVYHDLKLYSLCLLSINALRLRVVNAEHGAKAVQKKAAWVWD